MKRRKLSVELDRLDYEAIQRAIRARLNEFVKFSDGSPILPEHDSDQWGAALAEICRGWLEMHGKWPGRGGGE